MSNYAANHRVLKFAYIGTVDPHNDYFGSTILVALKRDFNGLDFRNSNFVILKGVVFLAFSKADRVRKFDLRSASIS